MSASEERISQKSSVQITSAGTQGCFLRSTFRLQMWVRRSEELAVSHKILATARPTVPNPTSATRPTTVVSGRVSATRVSSSCLDEVRPKIVLVVEYYSLP